MAPWIIRLHSHDERALHALVMRRRPRLDRATRVITHLGDAAVTIPLALAMLLSSLGQAEDAGLRAAFALVVSHAVVQLLKRTVTRGRPTMPAGFAALVAAPDRFSFPSGHAASSLSVALGLAVLLPPPLGAAVMAVALIVGASRCYLGVHYPGDVVVGWMLALLAFAAAGTLAG